MIINVQKLSSAVKLLFVLVFMVSCSGQKNLRTVPEFHAQDLNAKIQSGALTNKTDNFIVIMDTSSSMNDDYEGSIYPGPTKFDVEKDVVSRLNQTIPDLEINSELLTFGSLACLGDGTTVVNSPMGPHSKSSFEKGLESVKCASGITPMNQALDSAISSSGSSPGSVSFFLISDGKVDDYNDLTSATDIRERFGNESCLYTILVGNDSAGKKFMMNLADASQCGFAVTAEQIASGPEMAQFVEKALLTASNDSDGDGVPNNLDKCPATPRGVKVNLYGCWVGGRVLFDFDKDIIKPEVYPLLDELAAALKKLPQARIEIDGHTDNIGDPKYNIDLSKRRANAIRDYLISQGVNPDQLIAVGMGRDNPLYSNDTSEGRAKNRRVQLKVLPYK